jgi:hypothetical protein
VAGRPHADESQQRALEYARLVAHGVSRKDAARAARVSYSRALELTEDETWLSLVDGLSVA